MNIRILFFLIAVSDIPDRPVPAAGLTNGQMPEDWHIIYSTWPFLLALPLALLHVLPQDLSHALLPVSYTHLDVYKRQVLSRCSNADNNFSITIITDTINNLYDMLDNYEIDLAIADGTPTGHSLCSLMLATDYLVCVMSIRHPLAKRAMVTFCLLYTSRCV